MLVMASKLYDYTPTELQKLLDESDSYADLLRKVGLGEYGANRRTLLKVINEYNLDLSQININRQQKHILHGKQIAPKQFPLEEILVKDKDFNSSVLLKRLVNANMKDYQCEKCGLTNWLGEYISLHLHHKDGDHRNNEFENLEILCPNCHSQTENYAGKSKYRTKVSKNDEQKLTQNGISEDGQRLYDGYGNYKILCPECKENFMNKAAKTCRQCHDTERYKPKVEKEVLLKIMETNTYYSAAEILGVDRETVSRWHKYYTNKERENGNMIIGSDKAPSREVLKTKIRTMSFVQIGKEYHVTDNSVRKWCDAYNLPRNVSVIKSYSNEEWEKI